MDKTSLPKFIFVGVFDGSFLNDQMEPGTADPFTNNLLKVANCICRKSVYIFSLESF